MYLFKKGVGVLGILDKINHLLIVQGKKQKELTDFLGVSKGTFTDWKSGKTVSYNRYLPKIAEFFDVSVDYLVGKDEHPQKNPDDELNEYLEELRTRPEMKMLFSLTKNATKKDVEAAVRIIEAMLGEQKNND